MHRFTRRGPTTVLYSSLCGKLNIVNVKKNLDEKFGLRKKLEQFSEKKVDLDLIY